MKSHHESMKVMKARNYKRFYPKTGAWEGAEHLLPHLDAQALVKNNFLVHPVLFIEWCSDYMAKLATATPKDSTFGLW